MLDTWKLVEGGNFYLQYSLMPCIKGDMCPDLNIHRFIPGSLLKYVHSFIKNEKILHQLLQQMVTSWNWGTSGTSTAVSLEPCGSLTGYGGAESNPFLLLLFFIFWIHVLVSESFWDSHEKYLQNHQKLTNEWLYRAPAPNLYHNPVLTPAWWKSLHPSDFGEQGCGLRISDFQSPPLTPEVSGFYKTDTWNILSLSL